MISAVSKMLIFFAPLSVSLNIPLLCVLRSKVSGVGIGATPSCTETLPEKEMKEVTQTI